ncbi:hypothetical protein F4778DRAFT_655211 [Xylariomycetidae sp. FL2044]|nr:hypothetical protein F4778DRAFT_655211 [Xylariomycetidae sp. FL2044]
MVRRTITNAIALLAASQSVNAHSWVEAMYRIDSSGHFTGEPGYPMGYIARDAPGFSDTAVQNKITDVTSNPKVCKPGATTSDQYPRLSAAAGDYIAMTYEENGHVTQPDLTPRPYRGGNVYVYGTTQAEESLGINDVMNAWTADGKGGNGKGRLLATHFYDDGQCHQQVNAAQMQTLDVWKERKAETGVDALPCQTDLQLPDDLPADGTYTLMWVWDWPLIVSDTQNVTEIYTSCAEVQLGAPESSSKTQMKFAKNGNITNAAVSSQLADLIEATALGVGTAAPTAPSGVSSEPADVTTAPSSSAKPTSTKKGDNGVKTVTVTAEPETVTQYTTVTAGAGNNQGQNTATVTQAPEKSSAASQAAPTTLVPVTSVEHFLKARARVTGQARRAASNLR